MARALRQHRPPTIRDVAREAGVSLPTVSRVLTGAVPVSLHRQTLVFEAIERLGYRPNGAARALVHGMQPIIGIVAVDVAWGANVMIAAAEHEARLAGYAVSITVVDPADIARTDTSLDVLLAQPIAGIVVLDFDRYDLDVLTKKLGSIPVVSISSRSDNRVRHIVVDDRDAARQTTEHLLALGHETVQHIAFPTSGDRIHPREAGWRDALEAAHAAQPEPIRVGDRFGSDRLVEAGRAAVNELLTAPRLTAVFCANDQIAFGVVRTLGERGYHVPADVSVAGMDDEVLAAYWTPPLTSFRLDFQWAGAAAVRALLQPEAAPSLQAPDTFRLQIRQSTSSPSTHSTRRSAACGQAERAPEDGGEHLQLGRKTNLETGDQLAGYSGTSEK